jgi:uncharacterized protein (TIGR02453 family)
VEDATGRTEPSSAAIPPEAMRFFEGLEAENSKAYWEAHRGDFERYVVAPMRAVLDALDGYGPFRVFRPYRDLRFDPGGAPYKTQHGAVSTTAGGSVRYVHIDAYGVFVAAGAYVLAPDQLARFRAAVADERHGPALERLLADLVPHGEVGPGGHEPLRTAPRGYPKDHPRIELLRRKGVVVSARIEEDAAGAEGLPDRVGALWDAAAPLLAWLDEHVGPARE